MFLVSPIDISVGILLIIDLSLFCVCTSPTSVSVSDDILKQIPEELIPELYRKYLNAIEDGKSVVSLRRLFRSGPEYEIHVQKLKEVNGYKKHNLLIKRNGDNPLIYINNPVESKIPNAYLSIEEFKTALLNRAKEIQKRPTIHFSFTNPTSYKVSDTTHETYPASSLKVITVKKVQGGKFKHVTIQGNASSKHIDEVVSVRSVTHTSDITLNSIQILEDPTKPNELELTPTFTKTDVSLEPATATATETKFETDTVIPKQEATLKDTLRTEKNIIDVTKQTARSRKSTLGRPMVFMGQN